MTAIVTGAADAVGAGVMVPFFIVGTCVRVRLLSGAGVVPGDALHPRVVFVAGITAGIS